MTDPVVSVVTGTNADLLAHIAPLYIAPGSVVRDVTWGRGAFWKGWDTSVISLVGSDIGDKIGGHNGVLKADFRALPDADASCDVVVLDPPYIHNPGKHVTDSRYNNAATTGGKYHRDIREMYYGGMTEALRILRPGGRLLVKGMDELESSIQCWSQSELLGDAVSLGFYGKDMFVLVPTSRTPKTRWKTQNHARKVHSFLWVFEKPTNANRKTINTVDEDGRIMPRPVKAVDHPAIGGWTWGDIKATKPAPPFDAEAFLALLDAAGNPSQPVTVTGVACVQCGDPVPASKRGPTGTYCSAKCKMKAYRARRASS